MSPTKPYNEVESDFIREKIQEGSFENQDFRDYVDTLIYLEDKILNGASGYCDGMRFNQVRNELQEEYRLIYREVAPDQYKEKLARETVQAIEESLEPSEFETEKIVERLEQRQKWEEIQHKSLTT